MIRFAFALFLLCSCQINQEELAIDRVSDAQNICQYSEWLRIAENKEGVLIEVTDPKSRKTFSFSIGNGFKANLHLSPGLPLGVFSTTHIGMLAELSALEKIKATTDTKLIYNEWVLNRISTGQIKSFSDSQIPDLEQLVQSGLKILIHSGFNGEHPAKSKLTHFGIETIPNYDWMEPHPLGKAEWILFFGYLTGKSELAKERFNNIVEQYNNLVQKETPTNSKVLMGNMMGDFWIAPSANSFNSQYVLDAGGNYLYSKEENEGSLLLSFEQVVMDSKNTGIWLNPGFRTKAMILESNPKANLMDPFVKGKIYCYSHNSNKYWEIGPVYPHLILSDLMHILRNEEDEFLHFYKEVL